MIKININTCDSELDIEIKQNDAHYNLLVILSKSRYFQENGRAWHSQTEEKQTVTKIVNLIKACSANPSVPKRITINDGNLTKINLQGPSPVHLALIDIEPDTIEAELLETLFDYIREQIQDSDLEKYISAFNLIK